MPLIGQQLRAEIHEQPESLARLVVHAANEMPPLVARIEAFAPRSVIIAARGSSDNAARYAQYVMGVHQRWSVGLAAPSLCSVYGAAPAMGECLVIGISQSGESPDVVSVIQAARAQGALTLGLTNVEDSPLARAAEHVFLLRAGVERAVAASKTFTAQLTTIALLSAYLTHDRQLLAQVERVPEYAMRALDHTDGLRALAQQLSDAQRMAVVARGFQFATACELALKIKETSYITAEGYSTADFLHGPAALLEPGYPIVAIATSGKALATTMQTVGEIRDRGAHVTLLSDLRELTDARGGATLPEGVPEWLSPVSTAVAGQCLALELAIARGLDPDVPRNLAKVTRTT